MCKNKRIELWTKEEIEKVFTRILDEISNLEGEDVKKDNPTIEDKRQYLIATKERFEYCF